VVNAQPDTLSTPPPFVLSHPHRSSSDDRFPLSFRYDFAAKTHRWDAGRTES